MGDAIKDNSVPQELIGLSGVDGISISDGLRYCGSVRDFDKYLKSFYLDIDEKIAELEKSFKEGDISYFTVKVHALKTASRMIGATEMCELAYSLEMAGKKNELSVIDENLDHLLELYRSYKERLLPYMQEKQKRLENKKPISDDELEDAFDALKEVVPTLDTDGVEMILEELSLYELPQDKQAIVDKVENMLRQCDWDGLEELLGIQVV
ncbi:Hpt domain-containing protein [Pseudobutyrivibrio xylanivorans]|uniref:Hpt domain-containing protein n=1 Tax=Pseudobutyrivibrio xylanivorans TaxID=185007 RepID=A0A1G5RTT7_PSEXY|nr:Hpt domain-containing protein [Pseudobutyrivibrio xylanivorans]SCZ77522.1 Hpt domain-containing protein [Pseudobutyrivibrio xylanivorans]